MVAGINKSLSKNINEPAIAFHPSTIHDPSTFCANGAQKRNHFVHWRPGRTDQRGIPVSEVLLVWTDFHTEDCKR